LRYRLSLRDLAQMFLVRGFVFSYEAVRAWEAKLTPSLAAGLRRRRQEVPASTRRYRHMRRTAIALGILEAA